MGFLDGLTGNASRVDPGTVAQEYGRLFAQGEQVHAAYQLVRDIFLFTDRRLILVDKQGKVVYTHFGEGAYQQTEAQIQALLKQPG